MKNINWEKFLGVKEKGLGPINENVSPGAIIYAAKIIQFSEKLIFRNNERKNNNKIPLRKSNINPENLSQNAINLSGKNDNNQW